jgi:hypothetical protein
MKDGPSPVLQIAEKEDAIGSRRGLPVEDPEAWWEDLLLRDPRFRARVAQARGNLRQGRGISLEELREKRGGELPAEETSPAG